MPDTQLQEPHASTVALRYDVMRAAEQKLGRLLTDTERATVSAFSSTRMLQSMHRRFSHEATSPPAVERDLAHLAGVVSVASAD